MRSGQASTTAQRVAAQRLWFEREPAPYGDPEADKRLCRDVAGTTMVGPGGPMSAHLRGRTTFFDRLVVAGLDGGIGQVVIAAAGYDGRALRYAKPGVRFFELDHPDTQRDKRARLDRLGIDTDHVQFVAADFTVDPVDEALRAGGFDPAAPALFLAEGIAVYLDRPVLEGLLRGLQTVAAPGSRLGISLSVAPASPFSPRAIGRSMFKAAVAGMGEPVRTEIPHGQVDAFMAGTGWHVARTAGRTGSLVIATPLH